MTRKLDIPKILSSSFVLTLFILPCAFSGPLEDYVNLPDSSYSYTITSEESGIGYKYYVIKMYSQTWRSPSEVNRTLWEHWLTLIVPTVISKFRGLLFISGGDNGSQPTDLRSYATLIASLTGAPVALLEQVPNQPLRFAGENFNRREDEIIAYSFDKYLQTYDAGNPDPFWPVLLPMVKSAVRAMDTIQAVVLNKHGRNINGFVISGASKRGWTTWLTSAVDSRVIAAAPMVIDVLRMDIQMDHHYKCYGFYAPTLKPYNDLQIFERMNTPGGAMLRSIVDPISYNERYTMPKFIINSCGDEFFLPDSSRFYYHLLPGEKRLRYVPNTGHSLGDSFDIQTVYPLITYFNSVAGTGTRPSYSWEFLPDGNIKVQVVQTPTSVKLWEAVNPTARDFRYYGGSGPSWTSTNLSETLPGSKTYITQVTPPQSGWKAYMVELNFSNGSYIFTTDVGIMPYMRPYDDLDDDGFMDPDDIDDDCDWLVDEIDPYPWDSDNDGIPNYLDEIDNRDPNEIPTDCVNIPEGTTEGEGILEGTTEGEGLSEGYQEGTMEGTQEGITEGIPEGTTEGEGLSEGYQEGTIEGIQEGTTEGEGSIEGITEGTPDGEGSTEGVVEGITEGVVEGEGTTEGITEGVAEGTTEGEGIAEGTPEGEGSIEGITEGTLEGEGVSEGTTEGTIEEGVSEGIAEGTSEGEGVVEGTIEGTEEGEGTPEGEGVIEGSVEGEGSTEGEPLPPYHSADTNKDNQINLSELLRVIQFFNSYGYYCADSPHFSEDGYIPGIGTNHSCRHHASDTNKDWEISLSELLRLIQFFNSGGYYPCPDQNTEDGYCPGTLQTR
ncbi:MAG: PhoPQ-activated protein PqaA family protein [Candidatus Hydrogenedentes bacterium]|nr:PhoPQ-activated protein PqaA family protein [Candidatus Hydrogenedentota bacterium]